MALVRTRLKLSEIDAGVPDLWDLAAVKEFDGKNRKDCQIEWAQLEFTFTLLGFGRSPNYIAPML